MLHQPQFTSRRHKAQRGILSEVIFGNPQHGCSSMGVCKVHIGPQLIKEDNSLTNSGCSCKKAIAFLCSDQPEVLTIHFLNYSLNTKKKAKFFPGERFVVEAEFPLPKVLNRALGLGGTSFVIQPGHYPTKNDGLYHSVDVRLAPLNKKLNSIQQGTYY